jgi:hypothetical protein
MGRFCGGCASLGKLWSEIKTRTLAPAIAAIANSQSHQDRDSLGTIQPIKWNDIKKPASRRQTVFDALTFSEPGKARARGEAIDSVAGNNLNPRGLRNASYQQE